MEGVLLDLLETAVAQKDTLKVDEPDGREGATDKDAKGVAPQIQYLDLGAQVLRNGRKAGVGTFGHFLSIGPLAVATGRT